MKEKLTLKELRYCRLRMTQEEFAQALGVSRRSVVRYENVGAPAHILKMAGMLLKHPPQRVLPTRPAAPEPART